MGELKVLVFSLGTEHYAVPVRQIQSIERLLPVSRVPNTLPFVKGVASLRDQVIPIIDLRERFKVDSALDVGQGRTLLAHVQNATVGFAVDSVADVKTLEESQVSAPPALLGGNSARYLHGMARVEDRVLVILNLEQILSDAEQQQLREVETSVKG